MPEMEYTPEVVAQIREGKSPMEINREQEASLDIEPKRVSADKTSTYSKQARKDGWVPQEDWIEQGKDPDDWVDAPEFVRRGELMDRIKGQSKALKTESKRIKELEEQVKLLAEHNRKIAQVEYEKAKKALRSQKIEALEEQDHEAVLEIDDKLSELEEAAKESQANAETDAAAQVAEATEAAPMPKPVADWLEQNSWYKEDPILMGAADVYAKQYAEQHFDPALEPADQPWEDMFEFVNKKVRDKFPAEFQTDDEEEEDDIVDEKPKRTPVSKRKAGQVAEPGRGTSRKARGRNSLSLNDLSADERKAHDEFVHRQGIMTSEEYLDQLAEIREL
jgi:hypothetical protein